MINLTPSVGQRLGISMIVDDLELTRHGGKPLAECAVRMGSEVVQHMAEMYVTKEHDDLHKYTTLRLSVVAMTTKEFEDALTNAYQAGRIDAMRNSK